MLTHLRIDTVYSNIEYNRNSYSTRSTEYAYSAGTGLVYYQVDLQYGTRTLVLKPCAIRRFGVDWEISMGRLICTGFPLASGTLISDYLLRK